MTLVIRTVTVASEYVESIWVKIRKHEHWDLGVFGLQSVQENASVHVRISFGL